jgi:hypothetical protein
MLVSQGQIAYIYYVSVESPLHLVLDVSNRRD